LLVACRRSRQGASQGGLQRDAGSRRSQAACRPILGGRVGMSFGWHTGCRRRVSGVELTMGRVWQLGIHPCGELLEELIAMVYGCDLEFTRWISDRGRDGRGGTKGGAGRRGGPWIHGRCTKVYVRAGGKGGWLVRSLSCVPAGSLAWRRVGQANNVGCRLEIVFARSRPRNRGREGRAAVRSRRQGFSPCFSRCVRVGGSPGSKWGLQEKVAQALTRGRVFWLVVLRGVACTEARGTRQDALRAGRASSDGGWKRG